MKTSKAYVMRSLLPAKCRELVRAPDVSQAFAMLVLSLIDLSPSKKLSAGVAALHSFYPRCHLLVIICLLNLLVLGLSAAFLQQLLAAQLRKWPKNFMKQLIVHDNLQRLSGSI